MSRVVVVTARWGPSHGETGVVVRLLAGALTLGTRVDVVSLCAAGPSTGAAAPVRNDSVFIVHEVTSSAPERSRAGLVRAAFGHGGEEHIPAIAGRRLVELGGGRADGVCELISSLRPDSIVLAGPETWWLPEALSSAGAPARVVSVPLLGDDSACELREFGPLLEDVAAVGVLSRREQAGVAARHEADRQRAVAGPAEIEELEVAFSVNRSAADQLMVNMSQYGSFVVVLSEFPEGSPRAPRSPGADYVREVLGPIAVVEVGGPRWSVSERAKAREFPVGGSRANLWKLLRHAEVCLDLRPQGIVARETIESLLLGTPVVVPDDTVAKEHAERSNGGLWYRDYRDLFDAARAVLDDTELRGGLAENGRAWAQAHRGDQRRFSEQMLRFALG